jgi:signal peptidase II
MKPLLLTWLVATFAFAIDQLTKYGIVFGLNLIHLRVIDVAPPYLTFIMGWNTGINFGLFGGSGGVGRWVLIGIAVAAAAYLTHLARKADGWFLPMSLGLIIGGALGNALDRAIFGAVMDFLNMSCCGIRNPYTFNIADIFIFAGVFGVIGHSWWEERKNKGATE